MVHKWFTEICCGRTSTKNAVCSGRPFEITTDEKMNKINYIMLEDRWAQVHQISKMMNISNERVFNIMHEHLGVKKI